MMTKRKASLGLQVLKEKTKEIELPKDQNVSDSLLEEKTIKKANKKKQSIPIYVDPLLHDALHMIVFSERHKKTTFQTLFIEALDLLLEKRGLPSISDITSGEKTINL